MAVISFKGRHFQRGMILHSVRWYPLRYLKKAIDSSGKPSLINIEKSGANTAAIKQYNVNESRRIKIRRCIQVVDVWHSAVVLCNELSRSSRPRFVGETRVDACRWAVRVCDDYRVKTLQPAHKKRRHWVNTYRAAIDTSLAVSRALPQRPRHPLRRQHFCNLLLT
jgi:hypothetical protein